MRLAHARGELFIVVAQLGKHISIGVTKSASLSFMRCKRVIWPIDRIVVPPSLRTRSAIASVVAKI